MALEDGIKSLLVAQYRRQDEILMSCDYSQVHEDASAFLPSPMTMSCDYRMADVVDTLAALEGAVAYRWNRPVYAGGDSAPMFLDLSAVEPERTAPVIITSWPSAPGRKSTMVEELPVETFGARWLAAYREVACSTAHS